MYYAGAYIPKYDKAYNERIREIRDHECAVRNNKARKNMEELKSKRATKDKTSSRSTSFVSAKIKKTSS